ncbi:MAG: 3'-5' exonuclease, partial [bacterium]
GVANVLRYLELLEESDRVIPEETIERVERSLDRTYLPSPPEASRSRVSIMTVHKAKGLEFDHVFCPFLDWNPLSGGRSDQPPYLLETGKNGEGLLALRRDRRNGTQDPIYGLLRSREEGKRCAEAKRVLYVAVTRAKRGLHLSGAASWSNGRLCARSKHSPLAAVMAHEGIGAWDLSHPLEHDIRREGTCGMEIRINPPPSSERYSSPAIPPLPEPIPTTPEPVPYMVVNPSETRDFVPRPVEAPEQDHGPTKQERARGIVTHGILAGAAWGKEVPAEPAIAAALCAEGISPGQAGPLARSILDEVSRCMEEETCAWILDRGHPEAYAEWGIEDSPEAGVIRSGIVDRLIFDGSRWWIVDYKTVRTEGEDEGAVIDREALLYRPQMEAYRSMVSRWKGIVPDRIVLLLYFTAYRRAYRYP